MKKTILITGGAGFLGSSIANSLLGEGHNIIILDNLQRGSLRKLKNVKGSIKFINADIRDEKKVIKAAKNCTSIIHLAYINGTKFFYSKPDLVLDIAIKGMMSVLGAGKENNIKELFLASSSEVYQTPKKIPTPEEIPLVIPDPYNPRYSYGGGKIINELMAIHVGKLYFKKIVIFRPHNIYGPDMGNEHVIPELIQKIKKLKKTENKLVIQGTGKETRSYMYIEDFSAAFNKVFSKGKNLNTYNIGVMDEVSSKELAEKIANIMGRKINILGSSLRKGSTSRRCPDIKKLTDLGFKSNTNLDEGLKKTIDWYLKNQ